MSEVFFVVVVVIILGVRSTTACNVEPWSICEKTEISKRPSLRKLIKIQALKLDQDLSPFSSSIGHIILSLSVSIFA